MKHLPNLFSKSLLRCGLVATMVAAPLALAKTSVAQDAVKTETAEETVWGSESRNPFSSEAGASDLLNLMQQLNRGTNQSWAEFRASQQENLNSAADNFRARQLELLKKRSTTPTLPSEQDEAADDDRQSAQPNPPYRALW